VNAWQATLDKRREKKGHHEVNAWQATLDRRREKKGHHEVNAWQATLYRRREKKGHHELNAWLGGLSEAQVPNLCWSHAAFDSIRDSEAIIHQFVSLFRSKPRAEALWVEEC
jgi:hypothetical protein